MTEPAGDAAYVAAMTRLTTHVRGAYVGLLSPQPQDADVIAPEEHGDYLVDLNLDQVVEALVANCEEPAFLASQFRQKLEDVDSVRYRQEIFEDLADVTLRRSLGEFSVRLRQVRSHLDQLEKMSYQYYREGWFLDAAVIYCDAVTSLEGDLAARALNSRGLLGFADYLSSYVASLEFVTLLGEANQRREELGEITYTVRIKAGRVEVRRYDDEADYSAEVAATFERFKQGAVKDYRVRYRGWPGMDHVGAQILSLVARLFGTQFAALDEFWRDHAGFLDDTIRQFDRELQFYITYLEYIEPLESTGLSFCYPEVTDSSKDVFAVETFDVALARSLVADGVAVVVNEFHLRGAERVFVVSGPNQGGKTTFARTFGQLHHLASVGCPVPGSSARLLLFDRLFTHFEREEDLTVMSGKLEDDLRRIHSILREATTNSIVIMNEIFTSTTLDDARFLGTEVMRRLIEFDLLCVYVTFVDEIASLGETIVSMVSTIVSDNPVERTYRVVRGPADGLAYALALAEKFGVTYDRLRERIQA